MPYGTLESSEDLGDIIALIEFRYGSGGTASFRYTDHTENVTHNGNVYTPLTLEHAAIKSSGKPDKSNFNVKIPASAGVCGLYYKQAPNTPVQMIVFAGHVGDAEFKQVWTGRVQSVKFSGVTAELSLEPATVSLQRTGLRLRYQVACPHVLYGSSCRAVKTFNPFTVSSKTPYRIYVNEPIANDVNYIGGMIQFNTFDGFGYSTILRANPGLKYFDVSRNTRDLPNNFGAAFGCAKSLEYCTTVFNNAPNYGGCMYIPIKNPLGRVIVHFP